MYFLPNMTKFQIACKPGHRPSEHLYILRSVVALFQKERKCFLMAGYDLKKFFDFEEISDVMDSLYQSKIKGKLYRLQFNMNKDVKIKVKTPVGTSEEAHSGPIVAQGGVDAAILSANNVSVGVEETFREKETEIVYENVRLNPLSYMDDLMEMSETVNDAQEANKTIEVFLGRKNLQLNMDKSNYIIIGGSKERRKMKKELQKNPLMLCGVKMKEVEELKYLGDYASINNEESVHKTVLKRIGLAKQSIVDIRSVVEDTRASKLGGINIAFQLFEACVLSFVLHNSETWDFMSNKTIKVLDNLFTYFFRKIFRCSTGTPIPNLYWQSGFLKAGNFILQKKLMFIHHLANLPEDSSGREFFEIQIENNDIPRSKRTP